jgi:hypothetical protein
MRVLSISRYVSRLLPFFTACWLIGQSAGPPPAGDPAVFNMFLRYQDSLVQDIQKAGATSTAAAQNAQQGAAAALSLTVADFAKINPVYQRLTVVLQAIDLDANAYRDAVIAGKRAPDVTVIQQLSARRSQALLNAKAQLQTALTPTGWATLAAYMDGPFRQTIVRSLLRSPLGK